MIADPRLGATVQQISLNRKERPLRLLIIAVYLGIALGLGTAREYVFPALVVAASIVAAEPFDRLYLRAPSRPRYLMCLGWCLVDGILPCWIYFMVLTDGNAFSLFMALTMIWIMTSQSLIVRSHDPWVYALTVAPGFIGFASTIMLSDTTVVPADLKPLFLVCVVLQLAFAMQSGWVSRRIKGEMFSALERADAAGQSRDAFFAMVTHEIRTPLNGILGTGQMMSHEARTSLEKERAQTIMASGSAMKTLLDDLLNHAKLEAGQFVIRPVPMRIDSVARNVLALFADTASAKGLTLDHTVGSDVPTSIMGDATRIQQILSNLVSNAVKHTESGRIDIAISTADVSGAAGLDIVVRDTGPGIPGNALEHIFQPYRQLDDAVSAAGIGTGLGLAIARDLAKAMGGELTVASRPGCGSAFTLSLPAAIADVARDAGDPPCEVLGSLFPDLHVLVVDDALINRRIARSFLELADARVTEARNGVEALEKLESEKVDLVLTDMHMPHMGGEELLAAIRAHSRLAGLPVVSLTASGATSLTGFDAQLTKPLARPDLFETVRTVMDRKPKAACPAVSLEMV